MKRTILTLLPAIAAVLLAGLYLAQLQAQRPTPPPGFGEERPGRGPAPGAPGDFRPPVHPLMRALDADGDGEITTEEIANAPAALKKLDTNGDGKLSGDELRPQGVPRRPGMEGLGMPGRDFGAPGGFGGPGRDQGGPGFREGGPGRGGPAEKGPGGPEGPRDFGGGGPGGGFHLIPRFAMEQLELTPEQRQQIDELEKETKAKLDRILTPEQQRILEESRPPRPGERGPGGGRLGPGDGPGGGFGGPGREGDQPPRPKRPPSE